MDSKQLIYPEHSTLWTWDSLAGHLHKTYMRGRYATLRIQCFKHFNCLVGLLDPNLYTFSYTRSRSNLLFTMILTISSRIFQPESHRPIRDHAEFLLGRALLACDSAVESIWAIICLYHWKDANDNRGYTLIGFALRLAASADWNMTRRSVSCHTEGLDEATELQVRQRRDKHRVWLAIGNIDRT
jgi:hypothetical protein